MPEVKCLSQVCLLTSVLGKKDTKTPLNANKYCSFDSHRTDNQSFKHKKLDRKAKNTRKIFIIMVLLKFEL